MALSLPTSVASTDAGLRRFMHQVYGWMCGGLLVTGGIAVYMAANEQMIRNLSHAVFIVLLIAQFGLVFILSTLIRTMEVGTARFAFLFYAALNGVTLSVIFLVYTAASIASVFFVTAAMFGALCVYGYTTDADLTAVGSLCFMCLIGTILASVVNWWLHSPLLMWIVTYCNILIFCGLTAFDSQNIKAIYRPADDGTDAETKEAIVGALALYLDFINLFLDLLTVMGKER